MGAAIGTGDKKSVNVELNIVPFIDLMSCLTAFLLVTAVWVNIAQINIQPKGKTRDQAQVQQDDEHVTLSVLVQSDRIWVGLSRVNEVGARDIGHMNVVPNTRAVRRVVIRSKQPDLRALSECGFKNDGDEVSLRHVVLPMEFCCPRRVEVSQAHVAQSVRNPVPLQHALKN